MLTGEAGLVAVEDRVKLIQAESERQRTYLAGLPADAWDQSSTCDGWTVADVVAHLVWIAQFCADVISRDT